MHQHGSRLLLLIALVFPLFAYAQIAKDFQNLRLKGPVQQMLYTTAYSLKQEDGTTKNQMAQEVTAWASEGKIYKMETSSAFGSMERKEITEIDWEGDVLRRIREYDQSGSSRQRLDKQYLPICEPDGKIVVENVVYGKDELRATLYYEYSTSERGNEVVEMTMYKPSTLEPQGYYYIESDEWGEVMQIQAVGRDTGIFTQRISSVGDSVFTSIHIASSRMNRGTKDTFEVIALNRYDTYGNPTYSKLMNKKVGVPLDGMSEMTIVTTVNYLYEGDDPSSLSPVTANIRNNWVNSTYNIALTLGSSNDALQGIYSVEKIRDKDPEIVEVGTDWVFDLRESMVGEWYYDPTTELLTFKQRDHLVVQVKVDLNAFRLSLQPEEEFAASVDFEKG